jgi:GDPmannose 4,6-dehydratase
MWLMLQQDEPGDYVLATGVTTYVRDFVAWAFEEVGIGIEWRGRGVEEKGYDAANGRCLVEVDPRYFRPTEVETLLGDPSKAREKLGWVAKTSFDRLVEEMVVEDLKLAERDHMVNEAGYRAYKHHE